MYNNIVWKNPEQEGVLRHSKAFLLFTIQSHLFNSRQIDRQILSGLIILKLFFGKKNMWKMEVLHIFGLWDQKIDSWFMNPDPLIPTLNPNCCCVLQCHQYHVAPTLLLRYNHQAYQTSFYKRKPWYLKWVSLHQPLDNFVLTMFFASATLPAVIYYSELMSILQSILKWQFWSHFMTNIFLHPSLCHFHHLSQPHSQFNLLLSHHLYQQPYFPIPTIHLTSLFCTINQQQNTILRSSQIFSAAW